MDENIGSNVAVLAILDEQSNAVYKQNLTTATYDHNQAVTEEETIINETSKQNIIWTKEATVTLLTIYDSKMHMLDNPKKKSKMWTAMAEELKSYSIEVTPDQVRWKINALTKKYKDCIENGQGAAVSFKYFNEMHQILGRYIGSNESYRVASGISQSHRADNNDTTTSSIPFRKLMAKRKTKIDLDKQWIDYLKRQDELRDVREERIAKSLWLKEEELKLRKKELELKQNIAFKKIQLKEKKQEEMLRIEREKCILLKKLVENYELAQQKIVLE